ncbi:MAG: 1-phosphofructokinase family hexose kinase [archaeon]|nr:1-phosphofructokinase family hexose kinase [archaeon]
MIYCVLLNPSIDNIIELSDFKSGNTYKISKNLKFPVGKSISVALTLKELGEQVSVFALIGKNQIQLYEEFLNKKKITYEFIPISGETRSNITIVDKKNNSTTHLRFPGFSINQSNLNDLKNKIEENIEEDDYIVFSGSIPKNTPKGFLEEISKIVKGKKAKFIIDTNGEPLKKIDIYSPLFIKANLEEMGKILGKNLIITPELTKKPNKDDLYLLLSKCRLKKHNTKFNILTLEEYGSILYSDKEAYHAKIKIDNSTYTVGCGDSFLGGVIAGLIKNYSLKDILYLATACGAANTQELGAGILKKKKVDEYISKIQIQDLQ